MLFSLCLTQIFTFTLSSLFLFHSSTLPWILSALSSDSQLWEGVEIKSWRRKSCDKLQLQPSAAAEAQQHRSFFSLVLFAFSIWLWKSSQQQNEFHFFHPIRQHGMMFALARNVISHSGRRCYFFCVCLLVEEQTERDKVRLDLMNERKLLDVAIVCSCRTAEWHVKRNRQRSAHARNRKRISF